MVKYLPLFSLLVNLVGWSSCAFAQLPRAYRAPEFAYNWSAPGQHPDHIVLNLTADPATSMSVTWRTSTEVREGYAEIAVATAAPKFWRTAQTLKAATETLDGTDVHEAGRIANYHTLTFADLLPATTYAYRVGDGNIWSEWIQFRTAAAGPAPFSFLYVGDAQNFILELWSRLIREGYRKAPDAGFVIHAGDLVNTANSEQEWHEWFLAGGWIHATLPSLSTPGNHEYQPRNQEERRRGERHLSVQWRPQFNLPANGPEGLEETVYYVDYQDARIISLNSNEQQQEQVEWLEKVLADNPRKWTLLMFHHPIFSASAGRDSPDLRKWWKPVIDKYGVDLVLQGHDHSYARGQTQPAVDKNVMAGLNKRDYTGTVYVVSVSGGKMYNLRPNAWDDYPADRDRAAENTQLFQVIHIDGDTLSFESYTAVGELYDAFDLIKSAEPERPNRFIDRQQEAIDARYFNNTIPYADTLPARMAANLLAQFPGYQIDFVRYFDDPEFKGYFVRLSQAQKRINLRLDPFGNILGEEGDK